jgi:hypothetical protein
LTNNTNLYQRNSNPNGKTWEKWVELWWKWCYSKPFTSNPVSDKTGKLCTKNQIYSQTWFLAGTFGGEAHRVCKIPNKRSIFIPIVNDIISFAEYPQLVTEDDLLKYAKDDLDTTTILNASIDDIELHSLFDYRIRSKLFKIEIPLSDQGEGVVRTKAVTDGYWLFLKPLSLGEHTLIFRGEKQAFDEVKLEHSVQKPMFRVKVVYDLKVV